LVNYMGYYLTLYTNIPSYRPDRKGATGFLTMQAQPAVETSFVVKKGDEMSTFRNPVLLKLKSRDI